VSYARDERHALVETMRAVGPDAPTLCDGWNARDLAVHLILRERRLDATAGMFVPALSGHTEKVAAKTAQRPWDELLADIDAGPPLYSPFRPIDALANLGEMFVHHEDVLRGAAAPDSEWTPRPLPDGMETALLKPLKMIGKRTLAKSPGRVSLRTPDGAEVLAAGRGGELTVTGTVGELLLFAFGRAPVDINVTGDEALVRQLFDTPRGI